MRHWKFFLPRRFMMTNEMLRALRAAGYYEGACHGRLGKRSGAYDKFAVEAASIRFDVARMVCARVHPCGVAISALHVTFIFIGHERFDVDAGFLPAKELIDGICEVLGFASDRGVIRDVKVFNHTTERGSWQAFQDYLPCLPFTETGRFGPGVLIYLQEVGT